jgi:hypothetical protein
MNPTQQQLSAVAERHLEVMRFQLRAAFYHEQRNNDGAAASCGRFAARSLDHAIKLQD